MIGVTFNIVDGDDGSQCDFFSVGKGTVTYSALNSIGPSNTLSDRFLPLSIYTRNREYDIRRIAEFSGDVVEAVLK